MPARPSLSNYMAPNGGGPFQLTPQFPTIPAVATVTSLTIGNYTLFQDTDGALKVRANPTGQLFVMVTP